MVTVIDIVLVAVMVTSDEAFCASRRMEGEARGVDSGRNRGFCSSFDR